MPSSTTNNSMVYPLPTDTVKQVKKHGHTCQNPSLTLAYLTQWQSQNARNRPTELEIKPYSSARQWAQDFEWDSQLLKALAERWGGTVAGYHEKEGWHVDFFPAKIDWRLVVGLGTDNVLETGITLHHLYGVPIIPGSALKGLTRTHLLLKIAETLKVAPLTFEQHQNNHPSKFRLLDQWLLEADPKKRQQHWDALGVTHLPQSRCDGLRTLFTGCFGSTEAQGNFIFFDAVPHPSTLPTFKTDVMTPHYPTYYSDDRHEKPPADLDDPNPVLFLTVEETVFQFAVAAKKKDRLENVIQWLKTGLRELGVGSKTAAGYGYFRT